MLPETWPYCPRTVAEPPAPPPFEAAAAAWSLGGPGTLPRQAAAIPEVTFHEVVFPARCGQHSLAVLVGPGALFADCARGSPAGRPLGSARYSLTWGFGACLLLARKPPAAPER